MNMEDIIITAITKLNYYGKQACMDYIKQYGIKFEVIYKALYS